VTVNLSGAASATTTTDANGKYLFSGLPAGAYTVTVTAPAGYAASPSKVGTDTTIDSNGSPASVTLATSSSSNLTIDFGYVPPATCAGLTPGYWKNWKNHYTSAQFLTLLQGTIASGNITLAGTILSTNNPSLNRLQKFVLANQLTLNLTGTSLPNPSGGSLAGSCALGSSTLAANLATALNMLAHPTSFTSAQMDAISTILAAIANLGGG
jgi:hypothetical protein